MRTLISEPIIRSSAFLRPRLFRREIPSFSRLPSPGTSQTAVDWSVNGVLGGNNTVGTITPSGLYGEFTTPLVILTRCPAFLPRQFQSFARAFRVPDCGPSEGVRGVPECRSKERRPSGARHHNLARERRNPAKHPLGPSLHFGLRRRKAGTIPPEKYPAQTSN